MQDGFLRVAAATPEITVAGVEENVHRIAGWIEQAAQRGCAAVVFPELCLTGYTCGDLFHDSLLLQRAEKGLRELMERTGKLDILCAVGLPVPADSALYNCAAVFHKGRLLGLAAKSCVPNYSEFYELRHFTPADAPRPFRFCGQDTVLGKNLLFDCENVSFLTVGAEICEDFWTACPPGVKLAENGATLLLNLSCSDETVGKAEYRRTLVKTASAKQLCAYVYADAGQGESTTDLVFSGHNLIAENGVLLAESELFTTGLTVAEVDLELLVKERLRMNTWQSKRDAEMVRIPFRYEERTIAAFQPERRAEKSPFVPAAGKSEAFDSRCRLILEIQAQGFATRLRHTGCKACVLALSGGLDSTLALLVALQAFDRLGLDRKGILAVSMPCFGTTGRTKSNAQKIAEQTGVSFREISIEKAVRQHFADIGQEEGNTDVTFENAQARERTQVAMDLANQCGGLVIGTGDLSELVLGWATYNGDHMSMYAVNASIPKTLVRHLVRYAAEQSEEALKAALTDVLDTPVSPELLPPKDGEISQKTEELVGPYELHDFFLYYLLRFGFGPGKIFRMACRAFAGEYEPETVQLWLRTFYRRFFTQQFKRSCLPDGPKVGSVGVSPRGDWRMPSDASAALWLQEIDMLGA